MVTESDIIQKLNKYLKVCRDKYDESNLLGVCAYGDVNYDLAEDTSEIPIYAIYIPTFQEMCLNTPLIDEFIKINIRENIRIIDIRLLYNKDIYLTESLYAKYYIVNPRYEYIFTNFLMHSRDDIANNSYGVRLIKIIEQSLEYLKIYQQEDDFIALMRAYNYLLFCDKFSNSHDYGESMKRTKEEIEMLLMIKHGMANIAEQDLQLLEVRLKQHYIRYAAIKDNEIPAELKDSITSIIRASILHNSDVLNFIKDLTEIEKTGLSKMIKSLGGEEGVVNLTSLSQKTGISRTVYSNLITKLKNYHIAIVTNVGSKGTYIKIIEQILLEL